MNTSDVAAIVQEWSPGIHPKLGIVLGSGLGGLADEVTAASRISYLDLPGFPRSGVSSHRGELVLGWLAGLPVAVFAGRGHYYEHGDPRAMQVPIATLKALGAEILILTNAAGSLRDDVPPGSPMLITDHINWSGLNPLVGVEGDARFVDMVDAYDPALLALARRTAAQRGIALAEGVYMWFSGPSFETPAEIRMARRLGADAVGMSTVPENIVAVHMGMRVCGMSIITDECFPDTLKPVTVEEVIAAANKAEPKLTAVTKELIKRL